MIEQLRKQERRWSRTRWILLAAAVIILAIQGFLASQLLTMAHAAAHTGDQTKDVPASFQTFSTMQASQELTFALALFWPEILLGVCGAGWLIVLLIRDWHGRVSRCCCYAYWTPGIKMTTLPNKNAAANSHRPFGFDRQMKFDYHHSIAEPTPVAVAELGR